MPKYTKILHRLTLYLLNHQICLLGKILNASKKFLKKPSVWGIERYIVSKKLL